MADLFKFQGDGDCGCDLNCPTCEMLDDHLQIALECESEEELRGLLSSLFGLGKDIGYDNALEDDLANKIFMLEERRSSKIKFDLW